jgi:hypothetical protein
MAANASNQTGIHGIQVEDDDLARNCEQGDEDDDFRLDPKLFPALSVAGLGVTKPAPGGLHRALQPTIHRAACAE